MSFFRPLLNLFKVKLDSTVIRGELLEANKFFEQSEFEQLELQLAAISTMELSTNERGLFSFLMAQINFRINDVENGRSNLKIASDIYEEDLRMSLLISISYAETCYRLGLIDECLIYVDTAEDKLYMIADLGKNDKFERLRTLSNLKGAIYSNRGQFDAAIAEYDNGLEYARRIDNKRGIAIAYNNLGTSYQNKGEIEKALEFYETSLKIKNSLGLKGSSALTQVNIAEISILVGNLDEAKKIILSCLDIFKDEGLIMYLPGALFSLIRATVYTSTEEAKQFLDELAELGKNQENPIVKQQIKLSQALILNQSSRSTKKAQAQAIFDEISSEPLVNFELTVFAKLNLCELLIYEFNITPEPEILEDLKKLVSELFDMAKEQHSYSLLAEIYVIKSKIALMDLNAKESRKLLSQAEMLAEEKGLHRLAQKISNEHDKLLDKMDDWKDMIKDNYSLKDRLKMVHLEDNILQIIKKELIAEGDKKDIPVLLMILNKGGVSIYSKNFDQTIKLDDQLIAGFISAINSFSKEAFSSTGSLERIKHDEYILTMKADKEFSYVYAFQDNSYSASKKLNQYISKLIEDENLYSELIDAKRKGLYLTGIDKLDKIAEDIFIN